jgi:hypothetical protein
MSAPHGIPARSYEEWIREEERREELETDSVYFYEKQGSEIGRDVWRHFNGGLVVSLARQGRAAWDLADARPGEFRSLAFQYAHDKKRHGIQRQMDRNNTSPHFHPLDALTPMARPNTAPRGGHAPGTLLKGVTRVEKAADPWGRNLGGKFKYYPAQVNFKV